MDIPAFIAPELPPEHLRRSLSAEFQEALGMTLSRWQHIETSMFVVFHLTLGVELKLSSAVFFHIKSGGSKLDLVDKLLRVQATEVVQIAWKPIYKEISHWLEWRNAMAHFETSFSKTRVVDGERSWEYIMTSHHLDLCSITESGQKGFNLPALIELAAEYVEGSRKIFKFCKTAFPDWKERSVGLPPTIQNVLEKVEDDHTDVEMRRRLQSLQPWELFDQPPPRPLQPAGKKRAKRPSSGEKRRSKT